MTGLLPIGEYERQLKDETPPGTVYGYARVSTAEQTENDSIDGQKQRIYDYFLARLKGRGCKWGGVFVDPGVSAFKINWEKRPAGAKLLATLKTGDHVVVDRVDRMCRSALNMHHIIRFADDAGLNFHFLDCNLDPTEPMGEMIISVIAILAQLDSAMKGKRMTETFAHRMRIGERVRTRKANTIMCKSKARMGIRMKQKEQEIIYYINWREFAASRFIAQNREHVGQAWRSIRWIDAQREGRPYTISQFSKPELDLMSYSQALVLPRAWDRLIEPLLRAMPKMPCPPPAAVQGKETQLVVAKLNQRGEVAKWKWAYEPAECKYNYRMIDRKLLFNRPSSGATPKGKTVKEKASDPWA